MTGTQREVLPGTTFPIPTTLTKDNGHVEHNSQPLSHPGPQINSKKTTITLFSPSQLEQTGFLPSFQTVANDAFRQGHNAHSVLPLTVDRITNQDYLLRELGQAAGTFTYIVHSNDTEVIATASMWRFTNTPVLEAVTDTSAQAERARRLQIFKRHEPLPADIEGWELKLMFVNPNAQKQGLAGKLIDLCEIEASRRSRKEAQKDGSVREVRFVLTTIGEINGSFYEKRGYVKDYGVWQPPGTMNSPAGFTVLHMSKVLDTAAL